MVRSHNGCQKCKSLKKKCDEEKPECGYCKKKGFQCDYTRTLKWGGRPFKDNRVSKKMKFEHTYVVEGICAVDLNAAMGKQDTKAKKNKKRKVVEDKKTAGTMVHVKQEEQRMGHVEAEVSGQHMETALVPLSPLSPLEPLSLYMFEESPKADDAIEHPDLEIGTIIDRIDNSKKSTLDVNGLRTAAVGFSNGIDDLVQCLDIDLSMPNMSLASLMIPDILLQSPEMAESFDFFVNQTSALLVPAPSSIYNRNALSNFLPRMAMSNSALMSLLLVFGANHKHKILQHQGFPNRNSSLIASDLLTKTFTNLMGQLTNADLRNSDSTLATILLLAGFDIFFGDKKQKWRTHVYGARKIMLERFSNGSGSLMLSDNNADSKEENFVMRWFAYIDIITSLSSTNALRNIHKLASLKYGMETTIKESLKKKMIVLSDIEYFTGMEISCLWLLAEVSRLVNEKETADNEMFPQDLILRALEHDHKMTSYLRTTEIERDEIYQMYYHSKTDASTAERYNAYRTLRATNQIFVLTGVLQLKRRVLGLSPSSPIVKDLLRKISNLVDTWITFGSSAETCIIFCLFSCGCELVDPELYQYRSLFQQHLRSQVQKGVSSAHQAQSIMEECWETNKQWWDIFKEKNLDITFAL